MSERFKWISGLVFGLLVAVALSIGTQGAFAQPVTADCPDDGFNFLGSCSSDPECQTKCDQVHGIGNSIGDCVGNTCCQCLL